MTTLIKYNDGDEVLYCVDCKTIIQYGEKYAEVQEDGDDYKKTYHLEHAPIDEFEDE
ncbi:MAG: hypothetical protein M0R03_08845 [Novosphingobium sp.]|nr:hypothetical protein [Novosphingobium sp.]